MGMITAFNELLACVVTGLSTAIFLGIGSYFGLVPIIYISTAQPPEQEEEEE